LGGLADVLALHGRAADDLRFIRETMERATSFTGVSGRGYVTMGVTAIAAAWLASLQTSPEGWLLVWFGELPLAATIAVVLTARKARDQGGSLWSHAFRKLIFAFTPPMAAGALLTAALYLNGQFGLLPGLWLALYGAGVMTGGAYSVRVIPMMGAAFIVLGGVAMLTAVPGDLALGLGFGGFHIGFGLIVWRRYGG
jgi:hypothetical protein